MSRLIALLSEGEADFMKNPDRWGVKITNITRQETPLGELDPVIWGNYEGRDFIYLSHGGRCRSLPVIKGIAAAMWFAQSVDVEEIVSATLVGGINGLLATGDAVICHDYIDVTTKRHRGLLETIDDRLSYHCLSARPFCPRLSTALGNAARGRLPKSNVFTKGVYANSEGPRYETAAEIQALARLGADVVGHTVIPAVTMAREIRSCFAVACLVGNAAEGLRSENDEFWSTQDVSQLIAGILLDAMGGLNDDQCDCGDDKWWVSQPEVRRP